MQVEYVQVIKIVSCFPFYRTFGIFILNLFDEWFL